MGYCLHKDALPCVYMHHWLIWIITGHDYVISTAAHPIIALGLILQIDVLNVLAWNNLMHSQLICLSILKVTYKPTSWASLCCSCNSHELMEDMSLW